MPPKTRSASGKTGTRGANAASSRSKKLAPKQRQKASGASTIGDDKAPAYDLRKTAIPRIPPPGQKHSYKPAKTVRYLEEQTRIAEAEKLAEELRKRQREDKKRKELRKKQGTAVMTSQDKAAASLSAAVRAAANSREVYA
jgi:hypothetical protein